MLSESARALPSVEDHQRPRHIALSTRRRGHAFQDLISARVWYGRGVRLLPLALLVALVGCGDDTTTGPGGSGGAGGAGNGSTTVTGGAGGDPCVGTPAGPPTILTPTSGERDVLADSLTITVSDYAGSDPLVGVDVEIYSVKDGSPNNLVWTGAISPTMAPLSIMLASGTWVDPQVTALEAYEDYAVRARYRTEGEACELAGVDSPSTIFFTDDGGTYLFDDSIVRDVYLEIPQASMDAMNAQAVPPGCVPYHRDYQPASLTFEGQTFAGVGVHIKGGCGSARDLNGKASFKVNIDWDDPNIAGCPAEERRLFGQKHVTLNNGVQDQTAIHERLGYTIYRAMGIPAPRIAHVRVFVNGQLWGLYQHVETYDRRFLSRWFESNNGMLYEGTYWCDLFSSNLPPGETDDYCLTREFSSGPCSTPEAGADPTTYDLLRSFIASLDAVAPGTYYNTIQQLMDFDRFLTSWAIESYIAHWDAYQFYIQNNYRMYHHPTTGLWTYISAGIDQTFGGDLDPWGVGGRLAASCLAEPACEAAFVQKLRDVKLVVANLGLPALASSIHDQIAPYVSEDPRKEYDAATWEANYLVLQDFLATRSAIIDQHIVNHGYTP